jgi:hypothetical protein
MSGKWGRQLERKAKKINAQRKRLGKRPIYETAGGEERITGRSILWPGFLMIVGLLYMFMFWNDSRDALYWVTVISYLLLALLVFWLRKPFLAIGKNTLTTRKFAGFRTIRADEIEAILAQPGYVIIALKNKKTRLVFSRLINRFDTDLMAERLRDFAARNQVAFSKLQ